MVGLVGFKPTIFPPQTERDNQITLQTDKNGGSDRNWTYDVYHEGLDLQSSAARTNSYLAPKPRLFYSVRDHQRRLIMSSKQTKNSTLNLSHLPLSGVV